MLCDPSEAILTVPLVNLHDRLLGQVIEVMGALRVEPAAIDAVFFLLTHDEVARSRLVLAPALAELLCVTLASLLSQFLLKWHALNAGVFGGCSVENSGWLIDLACNQLLELVLASKNFLKECLGVSDHRSVLFVALLGRVLAELDVEPGEVVLGEGDGPVKF